MVVGEDEAIVGHNLARASASEDDDGVLDGAVVDAVDLLGREAAAFLLHDIDVVAAQEAENPHTLVGKCACGCAE